MARRESGARNGGYRGWTWMSARIAADKRAQNAPPCIGPSPTVSRTADERAVCRLIFYAGRKNMSCLATFYVLRESDRAVFLSAKEREPRIEEKKVFLFLKFRRPVAGEHVWEFLDRVATRRTELEFSGF